MAAARLRRARDDEDAQGIDGTTLTYLDAGRIAQESGCATIALHGRTVVQAYSGAADWDAIAALVATSTSGARQR